MEFLLEERATLGYDPTELFISIHCCHNILDAKLAIYRDIHKSCPHDVHVGRLFFLLSAMYHAHRANQHVVAHL